MVAIRGKEAPELDDEFARDFGDYENPSSCATGFENLASAEARADSGLREEVVKRILEDYVSRFRPRWSSRSRRPRPRIRVPPDAQRRPFADD